MDCSACEGCSWGYVYNFINHDLLKAMNKEDEVSSLPIDVRKAMDTVNAKDNKPVEGKNKKLRIIPLHDYVLLESVSIAAEKLSGIILPDSANIDDMDVGKIVELPENTTTYTFSYPSFQVGERVIFRRALFDQLTLENKKYLFGKLDNIIGRLVD